MAPNSSRAALLCLLLALVTFSVYWPVHRAEFINYDDPDYVSQNERVQRGLTAEGIGWAFRNSDTGNWHPLTWISHMWDVQWFGLNPGAHHLINVLFHIVNALLLFGVFRRATGAFWPSAFVATVFALHPLNVEPVAWIAERKHLLSTLFWMLTLRAYVSYAEKPGRGRYLLVGLFLLLGLLAKPTLVTVPFVLLLLDYWPLRRIQSLRPEPAMTGLGEPDPVAPVFPPTPLSRVIWEKIPFLLLSVGSSIMALAAASIGDAFPTFEKHSLGVRLGNALVAYVIYPLKMVWPSDLALFYPHPGGRPAWQIIGAVALLGLFSGAALLLRRRHPYILVGWLWYLGTLLPMSGLVQVGAFAWANRYAYVSLLGLFLIIAWGMAELVSRQPRLSLVARGVALLIIAALIVTTTRALRPWHDSVSLWSQCLAATPRNATAHYALGEALLERGQTEEGISQHQKAITLLPARGVLQNNLAVLFARLGRWAEGTNYSENAIRLEPNNDNYRLNYGLTLAALGQTDAAISLYESALQIGPTNFLTHLQLGLVLQGRGEGEKAIGHFQRALALRPGNADVLYYAGGAYLSVDRHEEAVRMLKELVRVKPDLAMGRAQLALALLGQNQPQEAVREFREALRLNQNMPEVQNNFAWLLATHPDPNVRQGEEAVRWAEKACQVTARKQPVLLGTLAAAYAEAGQFREAIATAEEAERLANSLGATEIAKKNRELLQLYRAGKPFHETAPGPPPSR